MLFEDIDQDMNYFGEQLTKGFVTEEEFLNSEYYVADMFETKDDLNLKMTTITADAYQNEPKKTFIRGILRSKMGLLRKIIK